MDEVDTILTKLLVQGERLTGKIGSLAIGLEHNERDIREQKEDLDKHKIKAWEKMDENTRLIGALATAQGKLIVKRGVWPKVLVCVTTLLGILTTIIALYKIGVAP